MKATDEDKIAGYASEMIPKDNDSTLLMEDTVCGGNGSEVGGNKSKNIFGRAGAGAVCGILIGAVSTSVIGGSAPVSVDSSPLEPDAVSEDNVNEVREWAGPELNVSGSVDEEMSFSEAFAAARNEIGIGGAFEWRGQLYGTYTSDEWESLPEEEKENYRNKFNWNAIDKPDEVDEVVPVDIPAEDDEVVVVSSGDESIESDDDIEVISVDNQQVDVLGVDCDVEDGNEDLPIAEDDVTDVVMIDVDTPDMISSDEVGDVEDVI